MATLMCGLITSGRLARAVEPAIAGVTASGAAADGHAAAAAVDGDPATYWQSPADSSMQDYRRFLDFDLHGTYSISQIDITNLTGSYYHYEVYLSKDGADYGKVAYKSDDAPASGAADTHPIDATEAAYARISVSYNSAAQQVNLAEVAFHGTKVSDEQASPKAISVTDFDSSSWGREWARVETDSDYAAEKTVTEVRNLVGRVIGERWVDKFDFQLRGNGNLMTPTLDSDYFPLLPGANTITPSGVT